ncbi:glycosyltransferase family 4 protein [Moorena producens JHB]|uniref:Glycosyltransferase family 4 protein n=1 Tax=Moorena producens (strain JHB) TaxID=1454205 RepID=A0A1D9FV00_MOOP1|nr:glycosyltransferase family 4 protein [Moorena producens]AOY79094.1 glycosyltransferase family 4 protein [Moorena producens JHB]
MNCINELRIAWLLPTAGLYWQPLLSEFTRLFPQTTVFAGLFPGFIHGFEESFLLKEVGGMKVMGRNKPSKTYSSFFTYLPPKIIVQLLQFKPNVIFSNAFSLWTLLALLFKPWGKWRVVIICDGSSPGVNYQGSWFRLLLRRIIARITDGFITNTSAGKAYLTEFVKAREDSIFARPYLVPDIRALSQTIKESNLNKLKQQHPVFLYIGALFPRKGLHKLLKACSMLQTKGYQDYTVLIVGRGTQHQELESLVKTHNLDNQVKLVGFVEYGGLGTYLENADIFLFPTIEDVWGMVVPEAMAFGKPILCSKWAGAVEMVVDGENGYVFDPHDSEELAELMIRFINNPDLINKMGEKSQQIMASHTLEAVSNSLADVVEFVWNGKQKTV